LRFRTDLVASPQGEAPNEYFVVKDPRSRRYFKLRAPEWWFVQQFNGRRSLGEVGEAFQVQFGAKLEAAPLSAFVERLKSLGVFEGELSEKESTALFRRQSDAGLERLLFIKLKATDPDVWLGALANRLRFLFRPGLAFSLAVIGSALFVSRHRAEFGFSLSSLLSASSLVGLVFAMFVVIALHEIAHGLVCRHLGGHVHEMGFLLLYFQPCLYCDLSDAWMFKERWKKLLVTFSGAYFQVLLGAVGVWGWRITVPGTWVNDLFWLLSVVSLFNVLFNFNPLIKLDGYYLLSDGLDIPNLRARAFGWMLHCIGRRPWEYSREPGSRERRIYWVYGVSALLYSGLLLGYLAWISLGFVIGKWRGPGLLLYLLGLSVMFRQPLHRFVGRMIPLAPNVRKTLVWVLLVRCFGGLPRSLSPLRGNRRARGTVGPVRGSSAFRRVRPDRVVRARFVRTHAHTALQARSFRVHDPPPSAGSGGGGHGATRRHGPVHRCRPICQPAREASPRSGQGSGAGSAQVWAQTAERRGRGQVNKQTEFSKVLSETRSADSMYRRNLLPSPNWAH
jgi:hypothetical protein